MDCGTEFMRPTSEQIQHAAYERWLRRGYSHGRDRDDWLAAEKELTFLLNYRTIAEYSLDTGDRSVVGRASSPRCRFCERTSSKLKSGPRPSVVPGNLGNAPPSTTEICEDCQGDWREPLDAEFRAFRDS